MNNNDQTFEEWFNVVSVLLTEFGVTGKIDMEAYRMYYDDGMTPEKAIKEDFNYCL